MPGFFKKLTMLLVGAALVGGGVGAVGATTASAAVTATHAVGLTFAGGPGHASSVWAGTWNNGGRGFCIDFGLATPNQAGVTVLTGDIPGMVAEGLKRAKYIANKYDNSGSPDASANAALAIWRLRGESTFNTWYAWALSKGVITTARHNAVGVILVDSGQHGPYAMSVSANQVLVGKQASGTVKILGSNGKPAVDRGITVTSAQGKILTINGVAGATGRTLATGAVFTYQRNTTGPITFTATLASDSSAKAGLSISSAGHQRTLNGSYMESAVAYFSYDVPVGPPAITAVCDTDCDGQATVTFQHSNTGGQAIKWTENVGAVVVATLSAMPGTVGTATARLNDGQAITTSSYCYTGSVLGGVCTTPTVVVQTPYEIVCPAWALADIKVPCNCTPNLPVTVTVTSPAGSPRFYRGFVSVNNGTPISLNLVNGTPGTITTANLGANSTVVVSVTVYRDAARTIPIPSGTHVLKTVSVY